AINLARREMVAIDQRLGLQNDRIKFLIRALNFAAKLHGIYCIDINCRCSRVPKKTEEGDQSWNYWTAVQHRFFLYRSFRLWLLFVVLAEVHAGLALFLHRTVQRARHCS